MRLLTVDIGNTNTTFGLFEGRRLVTRWRHPTLTIRCQAGAAAARSGHRCPAIVASVVPEAAGEFVRRYAQAAGVLPVVAGKTVSVPIVNRYRNPRQAGQDRLVNAYAARMLYGAPAVIIDCGTATTVDVVSRKGEYLGGMIIPGITMSLEALHARTALLPRVARARSLELIGRDTREGILSGVLRGTAFLIEAAALRLRKRLGPRTAIIGTGGDARLIARYCRAFDAVDESLTLKGLQLTFEAAEGMRS